LRKRREGIDLGRLATTPFRHFDLDVERRDRLDLAISEGRADPLIPRAHIDVQF